MLASDVKESENNANQYDNENILKSFYEEKKEKITASANSVFNELNKKTNLIIEECLWELQNRYNPSQDFSQMLERLYPKSPINQKMVERKIQEDKKNAVENALLLREYLLKAENLPIPVLADCCKLLIDQDDEIQRNLVYPIMVYLRKTKEANNNIDEIFEILTQYKPLSPNAWSAYRQARRLWKGIGMKEFFSLPENKYYDLNITEDKLIACLNSIQGLQIIQYIPACYTEAIIDFELEGYEFSTDNAYLKWYFFVDEDCPELILDNLKKLLRQSFQ